MDEKEKKFDLKGYISCAAMYFFFFMARTSVSVLISVYLLDKGYTATQVSIVTTVALVFTLLIQPVVGGLNDRFRPQKICSIVLIVGAAFSLIFTMANNIVLLAIIYGLVVALINSIHPTIEKLATTSKFKYGLIRFWGTIGYATGAQVSGIVYNIGSQYIYVIASVSMIISFAGMITGSRSIPASIIKKNTKASYTKLLNLKFVVYLLITALFYAAFNINATYLPAMLNSRGMAVEGATTLIFIASLCELPVVFWGGKVINKINNKPLLLSAIALLGLQMGIYSLVENVVICGAATLLINSVVAMFYVMINMKIVATLIDERLQMTALSLVAVIRNLGTVPFSIYTFPYKMVSSLANVEGAKVSSIVNTPTGIVGHPFML